MSDIFSTAERQFMDGLSLNENKERGCGEVRGRPAVIVILTTFTYVVCHLPGGMRAVRNQE